MAADKLPPPPGGQPGRDPDASIEDMRDVFARKTSQTGKDRSDARRFIEGKIEMIRRDPHLTEAQKAEAIAELEKRIVGS